MLLCIRKQHSKCGDNYVQAMLVSLYIMKYQEQHHLVCWNLFSRCPAKFNESCGELSLSLLARTSNNSTKHDIKQVDRNYKMIRSLLDVNKQLTNELVGRRSQFNHVQLTQAQIEQTVTFIEDYLNDIELGNFYAYPPIRGKKTYGSKANVIQEIRTLDAKQTVVLQKTRLFVRDVKKPLEQSCDTTVTNLCKAHTSPEAFEFATLNAFQAYKPSDADLKRRQAEKKRMLAEKAPRQGLGVPSAHRSGHFRGRSGVKRKKSKRSKRPKPVASSVQAAPSPACPPSIEPQQKKKKRRFPKVPRKKKPKYPLAEMDLTASEPVPVPPPLLDVKFDDGSRARTEARRSGKEATRLAAVQAAARIKADAIRGCAMLEVQHGTPSMPGPEVKKKVFPDVHGKGDFDNPFINAKHYVPEAIVDVKLVNGHDVIKIRWKGTGPEEDTWQNPILSGFQEQDVDEAWADKREEEKRAKKEKEKKERKRRRSAGKKSRRRRNHRRRNK